MVTVAEQVAPITYVLSAINCSVTVRFDVTVRFPSGAIVTVALLFQAAIATMLVIVT